MQLTLLSPAKINLCLHITGMREDGYHLLESVVGFTAWGDFLQITPAEETSLQIIGNKNVPVGQDNLIFKALDILSQEMGVTLPPFAITLTKNIPMRAGLGGGSSNAASVLLAIRYLFFKEVSDEFLLSVALKVGADVPVCLLRRTCYMGGIGEKLEPLVYGHKYYCLLLKPEESLNTRQVFMALENKNNPSIPQDTHKIDYALTQGRNDLTSVAIQNVPEIGRILQQIERTSPIKYDMSGSGSACFALYETEEDVIKAKKYLSKAFPHIFLVQTMLYL